MKKFLLILSSAGLCFSGYIASAKLFFSTCSFNEQCPYFLGYPACYYGFTMFLVLTILSFMFLFGRGSEAKVKKEIRLVALLGILFAGYFTLGELPVLFAKGFSAYFFGLPTCALGLIFYLLIFFV